MDLQLLIAQWSGNLPPGFVRPAILETGLPRCCHKRCPRKVAIKRDGTPAKACQRCLDRRSSSCRRRRSHFVAQGGCRRCVPEEGGRRFPLREVPRGSPHRARPEAPGRHRRRRHRRVRRATPARPPRRQPRPRRLALNAEKFVMPSAYRKSVKTAELPAVGLGITTYSDFGHLRPPHGKQEDIHACNIESPAVGRRFGRSLR